MAPNATARRNHDALFPGHVSTLAQTDPELIDLFDNFAFDEVLRGSELDIKARLMAQDRRDGRVPGRLGVPGHGRGTPPTRS